MTNYHLAVLPADGIGPEIIAADRQVLHKLEDLHGCTHPGTVDGLGTSNLFGDILTALGAALMGNLGLAPSANLNPERKCPSMFQAIHGSASDLAGKNQANPVASIWSTQMLLDHLGETELATLLMHAIEAVLRAGKVRTRDLGGSHSTTNMTDAVCQALAAAAGTGGGQLNTEENGGK